MAKFTIFLPDDLLADLDGYAAEVGESRSGVIREASALYLTEKRSARGLAARARAVEDSIALFERLAAQPVSDGRSSGEVLRELRGSLSVPGADGVGGDS